MTEDFIFSIFGFGFIGGGVLTYVQCDQIGRFIGL